MRRQHQCVVRRRPCRLHSCQDLTGGTDTGFHCAIQHAEPRRRVFASKMHAALGLLYERERAEELPRREKGVPTARPLIGVAAVRCAAHNVGVDRGVRGGDNYNRALATRLARYCARNPVALERRTYDRAAKSVSYRSDKSEGPTAGTETADPLEFLARVLVHLPDKGHVTTRYYGWYANRPRGIRRQAEPVALAAPSVIIPAPRLAPTEAARRWATLLDDAAAASL